VPASLHFTIPNRAVEFLDEFDQPVWILFGAGCFGKGSPILRLSLHQVTSVALLPIGVANRMPRGKDALFPSTY
jgi:hypothetical protein